MLQYNQISVVTNLDQHAIRKRNLSTLVGGIEFEAPSCSDEFNFFIDLYIYNKVWFGSLMCLCVLFICFHRREWDDTYPHCC